MTCLCQKACLSIGGIALALFLAYCVYFDYQRHQDPEFKDKLKERRQKEAEAEQKKKKKKQGKKPDKKDASAVNKYVLKEIEKAEDCLDAKDNDGAVDHFMNAMDVLDNPDILRNALEGLLPPEARDLLKERLAEKEQEEKEQEQAGTSK